MQKLRQVTLINSNTILNVRTQLKYICGKGYIKKKNISNCY